MNLNPIAKLNRDRSQGHNRAPETKVPKGIVWRDGKRAEVTFVPGSNEKKQMGAR